MPTNKGSFKIFTLAGITVYVHWMWVVMAVFSFQTRTHVYSSLIWNALEYLSLFLIVLIHEFGHQLACRSVGGKTHDIILWFLGGVAYVSPPQRPGAQLWSIAAGPLVNVALIPVIAALWSASFHLGWHDTNPNAYELLHNIWWINIGLLIFNMMPVYPLDGGQILRSLLWFVIGRAKSLLVASIIGFIGMAGLLALAAWIYFVRHDAANGGWLGVIAVFIAMRSWSGLKEAWALARIAKLPRRAGFACPSCHTAPPLGELWRCGKCAKQFDTFLTQGVCPHCGTQYSVTQCLDCGEAHAVSEWMTSPPANN
ncbi:MAG TPA: site-2 protease family protein [Candidatus Acidoferrales bacterium]|jgi:Zn-dependent protease|nr:site-2 protease family protein [Candidatus Acidoferrales bacterium]